MRVECESLGNTQYYGCFGFVAAVVELAEKPPSVSIISEIDGSFQVPIEIVNICHVRECEKGQQYFGFSRVGQRSKDAMMHQVGIWDHGSATPLETVTVNKLAMLEGIHLRIWNVVLFQTFPQSKCHLVDPVSVLHQFFMPEVPMDRKEHFSNGMKNALASKSVSKLLFPIHCPVCAEHQLGHWTLLVIEKKGTDEFLVRYYETMEKFNEICRNRALQLVSTLGLPHKKLERANAARQVGAECTEQVMYYMELECRHEVGERWGSMRTFKHHRKSMRETLGRFSKNLEAHRIQYVSECRQQEVKESALRNRLQDQIGKACVLQHEIDKLADISQIIAKVNLQHKLYLPPL